MTTNDPRVGEAMAWLERRGSQRNIDGMARYAIVSDKAFGVSVAMLQQLAKRLGRNHELAAALWDTGWYEARMLASLVDEPARVTPAQMDRWCRDFDNWAICDTVCFSPVRSHAARLAQGRQWTAGATSSSSARPLRCWRARRPRQAGRRRAVPSGAQADRARGPRRTELRQEGSELGPPGDGPEEPCAVRGRGCGGHAAGGF